MVADSTSPPLQALPNLALLPRAGFELLYFRRATRKIDRHDVPGKPCTRLTLHQASLLIGDPMSGPRVALADTKDAIA